MPYIVSHTEDFGFQDAPLVHVTWTDDQRQAEDRVTLSGAEALAVINAPSPTDRKAALLAGVNAAIAAGRTATSPPGMHLPEAARLLSQAKATLATANAAAALAKATEQDALTKEVAANQRAKIAEERALSAAAQTAALDAERARISLLLDQMHAAGLVEQEASTARKAELVKLNALLNDREAKIEKRAILVSRLQTELDLAITKAAADASLAAIVAQVKAELSTTSPIVVP